MIKFKKIKIFEVIIGDIISFKHKGNESVIVLEVNMIEEAEAYSTYANADADHTTELIMLYAADGINIENPYRGRGWTYPTADGHAFIPSTEVLLIMRP